MDSTRNIGKLFDEHVLYKYVQKEKKLSKVADSLWCR